MPIDFYHIPGSAPCHAVALTAAAVGVSLNAKPVDLRNGEQMKPEFLKMNPQHTVPTINDNGFILWESRPIMAYLVEQYGKNDSLYPKDPKKRAMVNLRLFFDACTLYKAFGDCYYPTIFAKAPMDQTKYEAVNTALSLLDKFLETDEYVAGKNMTIADLTLTVTVSVIEVVDHDFSEFKNISRWFAKMKVAAPKYEECNNVGLKAFKAAVDELKKK
ncbi:PREDICTED: glutathione S-transferase 1-1-like [Dufourea novaeangliae]|nr:PREDICTED: glutathione S-transferase 1-1-like [Dufourea novaeangliae]XP_015436975.1 PREDICTED: glutathione S-transferase 1-1-like [Dufourea novaeangliae]